MVPKSEEEIEKRWYNLRTSVTRKSMGLITGTNRRRVTATCVSKSIHGATCRRDLSQRFVA